MKSWIRLDFKTTKGRTNYLLKVGAKLNRSRKQERTFEADLSLLRRRIDREEQKDKDNSRGDDSFNEKEYSDEEEKESRPADRFD